MIPVDQLYDPAFFGGQAAGSLQSARIVLGRIFPLLQPRRVASVRTAAESIGLLSRRLRVKVCERCSVVG
jgi:hypothetical protein